VIQELSGMLGMRQTTGTLTEEEFTNFNFQIKRCDAYLKVYHAHQVRGALEGMFKASHKVDLTATQTLIIADWKQKFLLYILRESIAQYFGKAGICWHGLH
jgi:hypothetical protein